MLGFLKKEHIKRQRERESFNATLLFPFLHGVVYIDIAENFLYHLILFQREYCAFYDTLHQSKIYIVKIFISYIAKNIVSHIMLTCDTENVFFMFCKHYNLLLVQQLISYFLKVKYTYAIYNYTLMQKLSSVSQRSTQT